MSGRYRQAAPAARAGGLSPPPERGQPAPGGLGRRQGQGLLPTTARPRPPAVPPSGLPKIGPVGNSRSTSFPHAKPPVPNIPPPLAPLLQGHPQQRLGPFQGAQAQACLRGL